ncbi:hypothetical protein ASG47_19595 [Devosia sp. Leaf420]|uniref:hypothetical protein n=1 Tax=Devosia sp. Leaf420 TaxID=1736374 RepID=UPI0007147594|nr:hypothetical protein [Devosia sp. Leaf420]KQT50310.1 hypothetical protein ASG47_19595 [Devosia sp. Leaf420]
MSGDVIDLGSIPDETLMTEVLRRAREKTLSQDTARALLQTMSKEVVIAEANARIGVQILRAPEEININALGEAAARFARREYEDMFWNLEKALGRRFRGLSDLGMRDR